MTARLDSEFLDDVGLGALPEEAKGDLLQRIYSELDERVGERLTRGMSDEMLDEFGHFVERDEPDEDRWFSENLPYYAGSEDFRRFEEANPGLGGLDVKSQYGAMKWLQLHRPDYPQVVFSVLDELRDILRDNREFILTEINRGVTVTVTALLVLGSWEGGGI